VFIVVFVPKKTDGLGVVIRESVALVDFQIKIGESTLVLKHVSKKNMGINSRVHVKGHRSLIGKQEPHLLLNPTGVRDHVDNNNLGARQIATELKYRDLGPCWARFRFAVVLVL
jgi:hypothetical protein